MWLAMVPTRLLLLLLLMLLVSASSLALSVIEALQRSYQQQHFETLLLMRHSRQLPCHQLEQVAADGTWPVLRLSSEANYYLKAGHNSEMMALICLSGDRKMDTELWQALANNLCNMRHVRLLLMLQQPQQTQSLDELAHLTWQHSFPHVVLLLPEGSIFQLQPYTTEHWLRLPQSNENPLFVRQYNYHRLVAYTLPDRAYREPQTGELRPTGFVAKMMEQFVRIHNISLRWHDEVQLGERLSIVVVRNLTLNGTLNLPITLCGFEVATREGYYTYPFDVSDWFVVVPCAQEIPTAEVYLMVCSSRMLLLLLCGYCIFALLDTCFGWLLLDRQLSWTNLVLNERMISGIIGQPFKLQAHSMTSSRLAQAQLFLVGLIVSTLFAAQLKTLLTKRPIERMITNFEQLRDSHLTIHFSEGEQYYINKMGANKIDIIKSKIQYLKSSEFYEQRTHFNRSKAFSTTSIEWQFVNLQQSLFERPALCFHRGLIFRYRLLAALPLQANSVYAEPLERHMQRVHETGLVLYWKAQSLRDSIRLGEICLKDPNPYVPFHDFKVADLFWVWLGWASVLAMAFVIFLCELIVYRYVN